MCKTGKNCQLRRRRPTSFSCSNSLFARVHGKEKVCKKYFYGLLLLATEQNAALT
jgi:hypothetical protein